MTARASRAGTRAARMVRLIRLLRIAKLLEVCVRAKTNQANPNQAQESKVGQHLSEQTTRKAVILVLLIAIVFPLFHATQYERAEEVAIGQLSLFSNLANTSKGDWNMTLSSFLEYFSTDGRPVVYLSIRGNTHSYFFEDPELRLYRAKEIKNVETDDGRCYAQFSYRSLIQQQAVYAMIQTCVILFLLVVGAMLFERTTGQIVLKPINRMLSTIQRLYDNPLMRPEALAAATDGDKNETGMLERTLTKLTALLQIGFGVAGANIIQSCLNISGSGEFDPLIEGQRMLGIFGFCDIRRFTDATECLQEEVMLYVNEIAAILHGQVHHLRGMPNKNIGDAFLLVWPLPKRIRQLPRLLTAMRERKQALLAAQAAAAANGERMPSDGTAAGFDAASEDDDELVDENGQQIVIPEFDEITAERMARVNELADSALYSFVRTIIDIEASDTLQRFASNPRVLSNYVGKFEVRLGFGLHVGWAIQGPIGSRFKIDASYLSPDVNMSESLESVSKEYGQRIMMSEEFYTLLSPSVQARCRRADVVQMSGRPEPVHLYCYDMDQSNLTQAALKIRQKEEKAAAGPGAGAGPRRSSIVLASPSVSTPRGKSIIQARRGSIDLKQAAALDTPRRSVLPRKSLLAAATATPAAPAATAATAGAGARVPGAARASINIRGNLKAPVTNHVSVQVASPPQPAAAGLQGRRMSLGDRLKSQFEAARPLDSKLDYKELFSVQASIPDALFSLSRSAVDTYVAGDWQSAREQFQACLDLYPHDGVAKNLMAFMEEHSFQAPHDWNGCRGGGGGH